MSSQFHELFWSYSCGLMSFEQLKEQLRLLNEAEEIKKAVA